ncbi:CAP domain-containing protein [Salinihabitans flavidus]|nr:CAP domain-containing protein [Salinihabitans flavidus]
MTRLIVLFLSLALAVAGCAPGGVGTTSDGTRLYRIGGSSPEKVQYRMLDSVNALRRARGAQVVELDSRLNAAAATHSRDMSIQNRPWHFGSDGSSPVDRVERAGYPGRLTGEAISETYETELETLGAWIDQDDTRAIIVDPEAQDMGFAWFQEDNGKIWWTLIMGTKAIPQG